MKYKLTIHYEYVRDMQEIYNELIEDGYLPDEAEKEIRSNLEELVYKMDCHADNVFWGGYTEYTDVEEIDE